MKKADLLLLIYSAHKWPLYDEMQEVSAVCLPASSHISGTRRALAVGLQLWKTLWQPEHTRANPSPALNSISCLLLGNTDILLLWQCGGPRTHILFRYISISQTTTDYCNGKDASRRLNWGLARFPEVGSAHSAVERESFFSSLSSVWAEHGSPRQPHWHPTELLSYMIFQTSHRTID